MLSVLGLGIYHLRGSESQSHVLRIGGYYVACLMNFSSFSRSEFGLI